MTRTWLASVVWSFASISLLVVATGCATVYSSVTGPDEIRFTSDPSGASVELANGDSCETPCVITIAEAVEQDATATLKGYEQQTKALKRRLALTLWGNMIFGVAGILFVGVDYFTGAMWTQEDDAVNFRLNEDDGDGGTKKESKNGDPNVGEREGGGGEPREALDSPRPEELPLPESDALRRLQEVVKPEYLDLQIGYYYGVAKGESAAEVKTRTRNRLLRILLEMQTEGERLDIDEAVRRDHFRL